MNKLIPVLLVFSQFILIIFLAFTGEIIPSSLIILIFAILSLLFGVWAMAEMKFRFNIFPELLKNSLLVTSGPFKFVRHPIYTSVILITLFWIINDFNLMRLFFWVMLLIVLNIKIFYEEIILLKEFSAYKNYKSKTKKLIPFIY